MGCDTNCYLPTSVPSKSIVEWLNKNIGPSEIETFGTYNERDKDYYTINIKHPKDGLRRMFCSSNSSESKPGYSYHSLGHGGSASEIMKGLAIHFGGFFIENDYSDEEEYFESPDGMDFAPVSPADILQSKIISEYGVTFSSKVVATIENLMPEIKAYYKIKKS